MKRRLSAGAGCALFAVACGGATPALRATATSSSNQRAAHVASAAPTVAPAPPSTEPVAPSAAALDYVVAPVALPEVKPSIIYDIQGAAADDVWLLGEASADNAAAESLLFRSDGTHTRLVARNICPSGIELNRPGFQLVRPDHDRPELFGLSAGANQQFLHYAKRLANGLWDCDPEGTPSGWSVVPLRSAGQALLLVLTLNQLSVESAWGPVNLDTLMQAGMPQAVAVAARGAHAWLVVRDTDEEGSAARLMEWTGMRWREHPQVLPGGLEPTAVLALSVTESGRYFGVTQSQLLSYDGERFVAVPAPLDFAPQRLFASEHDGVWVFGPHQVWRYQASGWATLTTPLEQIGTEWLSPSGELWLGGKGAQGEALVVRLAPKKAN